MNNKSFTSLQSLFDYLEGLSATDDVTLIIKTPSSEAPFYRQYLRRLAASIISPSNAVR